MYDPAAMAPPVRAATAGAAAASHPLHKFYIDNINQRGFFQGADGLGSAMDEEAVRVMRATYFGLMTEIDDHLGRVFDFLLQTAQWDDTLIVFTCDHGEQLGDHYLPGKTGRAHACTPAPHAP